MKRALLSSVLFFVLMSKVAHPQTWPSSCSPTPFMETIYWNDIQSLAYVRAHNQNSPWKDSIRIDINSFCPDIPGTLYAVYNMPGSLLKDTIMNLFGFSDFNSPNVSFDYYHHFEPDSLHSIGSGVTLFNKPRTKHLQLQAKDTAVWVGQWVSGNYNNTANQAINDLVNTYQLTIVQTGHFSTTYAFSITVESKGLNIPALFTAFANASPAVVYSNGDMFFGDASQIRISQGPNGDTITYFDRCGDCPSGCTYGTSWRFYINNQCDVAFLDRISSGDNSIPGYPICLRTPLGVAPVTFATISASWKGVKALINWKILTELNTKNYIIQRSVDGVNFSDIATVAAIGNTTTELNYKWTAEHPLPGASFYRIKSVDYDGRLSYSQIVKLNKSTSKIPDLTIFPNPVKNGVLNLEFSKPVTGNFQIIIYDLQGRKVWEGKTVFQQSSKTIYLANQLSGGIYALVCIQPGKVFRQIFSVGRDR
jgi:hypothetical protein